MRAEFCPCHIPLGTHRTELSCGSLWEEEQGRSLCKTPSFRVGDHFTLPASCPSTFRLEPSVCKLVCWLTGQDRNFSPNLIGIWLGVFCFSHSENFGFLLLDGIMFYIRLEMALGRIRIVKGATIRGLNGNWPWCPQAQIGVFAYLESSLWSLIETLPVEHCSTLANSQGTGLAQSNPN